MGLDWLETKPVTDVFTNDANLDRRQCRRTVPMRVLALGMGRTGTASLRMALKELGFQDCYHMMSASVENPADCRLWSQAFAAKYDKVGTFEKKDWDSLLGHCQAVCDWPAIAFSRELIEAYPEAKVLYTSRDVNSWHRSVLKTVDWRANDGELRFLSGIDYASSLYYPMLRKFWDVFFDGNFLANGKTKYAAHYTELCESLDGREFLEFRVQDGWKPLCRFLEVPVPKTAFPHVNDSDNFVARCKARNRAQLKNAALRYAVYIISLIVMMYIARILMRGGYLAKVPPAFSSEFAFSST